MAYKADFIIAFFSSMAATVLGFGFVLVLFSKIPKLQDWSFNEVMFLYGFSLIPLGFFNVVSWNLYEFGELYIIEGRFDRVMLRPIHTLFQVIFEKFRLESPGGGDWLRGHCHLYSPAASRFSARWIISGLR